MLLKKLIMFLTLLASTNENGSSFQSCVVNTPTSIQPSTTSSPLKPSNATSPPSSECSGKCLNMCTVNSRDGENYGNGNSIMWMTDVALVAILTVVLMCYGVVIVKLY